jgi:hypothetical protein
MNRYGRNEQTEQQRRSGAGFDYPKSGGWTGWSVRFLGCRARRNSLQWPFHSKELQRSHVPQKLHNLPRSELTIQVNVEYRENPRGSWF